MNDLRQAFGSFALNLLGEEVAPSRARERLLGFPADPGFWLAYARVCQSLDDFREGSLALATAGNLMEQRCAERADSPGIGAVRNAFLREKLKIYTDMLRIAVRGNPVLQPELIRNLQALLALNPEAIRAGLEEALTMLREHPDPLQRTDLTWGLELTRLLDRYHRPQEGEVHDTLDALSFHLMCEGRYREAEQLLEASPGGTSDREDDQAGLWYRSLLAWLKAFRQDPLGRITPFAASGQRYVLAVVVWGDPYLDTLEGITLPSLLASGNLPYLQGVGEVRLILLTNEAGARRLETMPVLQAIRRLITVDIVTFPTELSIRPEIYKLMSAMHLASLEIARASRSHFTFVPPDVVFSEHFLRALDQRREQGAEVVFVPGLIMQSETFLEEQVHRFPVADLVLSLSPRELLELGLRHLHPFVRNNYTYTPNGRRSTVAVFMWPLANGGYVVHGYHHSPFLISAQAMARFDGSMFQNLDGDFLPKILRSREEAERCAMLSDPLEATYFELSRSDRFGRSAGKDMGAYDAGEFDLDRIARWGALLGEAAKWLLPRMASFDPAGTAADDPAQGSAAQFAGEVLEKIRLLERDGSHLPLDVGVPGGGAHA